MLRLNKRQFIFFSIISLIITAIAVYLIIDCRVNKNIDYNLMPKANIGIQDVKINNLTE